MGFYFKCFSLNSYADLFLAIVSDGVRKSILLRKGRERQSPVWTASSGLWKTAVSSQCDHKVSIAI